MFGKREPRRGFRNAYTRWFRFLSASPTCGRARVTSITQSLRSTSTAPRSRVYTDADAPGDGPRPGLSAPAAGARFAWRSADPNCQVRLKRLGCAVIDDSRKRRARSYPPHRTHTFAHGDFLFVIWSERHAPPSSTRNCCQSREHLPRRCRLSKRSRLRSIADRAGPAR